MNTKLSRQLITMAKADKELREDLASEGSLFKGYHPLMKAVHDQNAEKLSKVVKKYGWPGKSLVGEEGADAAWLILQHAIAHPQLQRECFPLLVEKVNEGEISPVQVAMLEDRIRCFEGRPQRFGTQFDWDENGKMSPLPVDDMHHVEVRRKHVGLSPLAEETERKRKEVAESKEHPPVDYKIYLEEKEKWLNENGWR